MPTKKNGSPAGGPELARAGWLGLQGWDGLSWSRVLVIGATPKRWRIRAIDRTVLAGRRRILEPGAVALVPRGAVRFSEPTNGG